MNNEVERLRAALARAAEALRQCANLTRHQEESPSTVREVGKRIAVIAMPILSDPDGARALAERRTMERCSEILRHALATGHIGHPADVQEATTALAAIDAARGRAKRGS